jgi:flagellar hook protein FlgE
MTAVTGVRSHQVMLDVTGNNIANVNTTGFKKDSTIFQDLLYQTSQGATGPGDTRGGVNPAQVGLGVKIAAIETIHTQGAAQYTGNKADMMISGEGYYILRSGNTRIYSRAGNFTLDADKTLVHSGTGYAVQGYEMTRNTDDPMKYDMAADVSDIVIPIGTEMEARATTLVGIWNNLDSTKDVYVNPPGTGGIEQTKLTVYDCQGNPYTMEVTFTKAATENTWNWEVTFPDNVDDDGNPLLTVTPSPDGTLTFGECGRIVDPLDGETISVNFSAVSGADDGIIKLDFSNKAFKGDDYEWATDSLEGVTQFAEASTVKAYYQDGYQMGVLSDYTVSQDGTIVGQYTNGQNQPIYRVGLAKFANPMGLEKIGDTMFRESINSGMALIDPAMENGLGTIAGGYLEMSNVDLTEEFTRLIISQRGFQANTRVVTTSDQILEEVVNLKR